MRRAKGMEYARLTSQSVVSGELKKQRCFPFFFGTSSCALNIPAWLYRSRCCRSTALGGEDVSAPGKLKVKENNSVLETLYRPTPQTVQTHRLRILMS